MLSRFHQPQPFRTRPCLVGILALISLVAPCVVPDLAGPAKGAGTYTIHGRIVCGLFGFGISGIKLYGLPGDPKTDGDGYYSATVPEGWSGAAYPLEDPLHFDPFGRNYVNVTSDLEHNYKTTLPVPVISGYVKTPAGPPIECVTISGAPKNPMTNYHGFYLTYVSSGKTYTLTPQKAGYTFTPASRTFYDVDGDSGNQNFTGTGLPSIEVSPTSGLVTTESGGTAQFTVVLTAPPTADVTIGVSSNDTSEGTVSPAELTFTPGNWSTAQTVTVTGKDDALRDGNVAYTVVTDPAVSGDAAYQGQNPPDVSVTNLDNDTPGFAFTPTSGLVTTENGGTATFTVALQSAPTADVSFLLATDDITEGSASPSSLTFTPANWSVPQTVTVAGVDDVVRDGDKQYKIETGLASSGDPGYNGLKPPDVSVTNRDNDGPPILSVSPPTPVVFPETETGQYVESGVFTVTNSGGGGLTGTAATAAPFSIVSGGTYALLTGESQVVGVRFSPTAATTYSGSVTFTSNGGNAVGALSGTGTVHTVVVDNSDGLPAKRFEVLSGTWPVDATRPNYWGGDYRTTSTGDGSSVAAWWFQVRLDGIYEVSAWWPSPGQNWAGSAPYRVHHATGNTLVPKSQRSRGGAWNSLGQFEFWSGMDWRVELANNSSGATVVADAVRVTWRKGVKPKIKVTPNSALDFGLTRVGDTKEVDAYVITNAGKAGRVVGQVTVPAPFQIVAGSTFALGAGQSQVVRAGYSPPAEHNDTATLQVTSNAGGATRSVRGTALIVLPPILTVEPAGDVNLGTATVGGSVEQDAYTVRNDGDQPLSGWVTAGGAFAVVSSNTYQLDPGASQAVRLRFSPTTEAAYRQTVSFTSNGGTAARTVRGQGAYLVVDNADNAADRRFGVLSGTWPAVADRSKRWASDYASTPAGNGNAVAAWYFQVPSDGVYEVCAWWPRQLSTWGSSVPYAIIHRGGSSVVRKDQRTSGGRWNILGSYEFLAGEEWRVEITNDSPGTVVVADAIRLRRTGALVTAKQAPGAGASETVEPLAIAASPLRGVAPLDVLFEALGVSSASKCKWQFGDDSNGSGPFALHTYYSPGSYTVTLTADGRTAIVTITVDGE